MRILYVINAFDPGGAEHGLITLIRGGFFSGHDLKVLCFARGAGQLLETVAKQVGHENLIVAMNEQRLGLSAIARGTFELIRTLRAWRPDYLVLSLKQANIVGRFAACLFPKVHCVAFEHIARYRARRAQIFYPFVLWLLSFRVDEIWADCRETLVETRRYFLTRRRSENVVPLFYVSEDVTPKRDYSLADPIRLAAAGRIVSRKNFVTVVQTVAILREKGMNVTLDIFGDGPDIEEVNAAITKYGLEDRVLLQGYREHWFGFAVDHDIFVNLSDTEGFCIVVAEAMSIGLPTVATDVGGIREYGRHAENMLKLNYADSKQLAEAIDRLVRDHDLRCRLGTTAHADIVANYEKQKIQMRGKAILGRR